MKIFYTGPEDVYPQLDASHQALFNSHRFKSGVGTLEFISGVSTIPNMCFKNVNMTTIIIPEGIVSLGWESFSNTTLVEMDLPSTLRSTGLFALSETYTLKNITCRAVTPPTINGRLSPPMKSWHTLYVPAESVEAYKASQWREYFVFVRPIEAPCTHSGKGFNTCQMLDTDYIMQEKIK